MKSTEQNLVRVDDVLGEIKRQIGTLERQAKKAARYKRLHETQRILELSLAADERARLQAQVTHETASLAILRDEILVAETQLAGRNEQLAGC